MSPEGATKTSDGPLEIGLGAPHASDSESQQDLTVRAELEDLLPLPHGGSRLGPSARGAVGDPDLAVSIDEEAVRPCEDPSSEVLHEVSVEVELEYGIQLRIDATVGAAAVQHPDVPSVGVRKDARDGSPRLPRGQLCPVRHGAVFAAGLDGWVRRQEDPQEQEYAGRRRTHGWY
jgi:hypothetical protein